MSDEKLEAKASRSEEAKQWRRVSLELPDKITIPDWRANHRWRKASLGVKKVNCQLRRIKVEAGSQAHTHTGNWKSPQATSLLRNSPETSLKSPKIISGLSNCSVISLLLPLV